MCTDIECSTVTVKARSLITITEATQYPVQLPVEYHINRIDAPHER